VRKRDLLLLDLPGGERLVITCDVAGGIGPLAGDLVHVPGYVLGRLTARVALMELLASGARPIGLCNLPAVSPDGAGAEILRGVLAEARLAGLGPEAITGSFEKNIPVRQSALGVTAFGILDRDGQGSGPGGAQAGDLVVAIGRPKVGAEVRLDDPELPDLDLAAHLAADPLVHELLPVGSRGIRAEVEDLARGASLTAEFLPQTEGWDLAKSAGPSTVLLATVPPVALPGLALILDRPWTPVAQLQTPKED
jgi:hypothetical protein